MKERKHRPTTDAASGCDHPHGSLSDPFACESQHTHDDTEAAALSDTEDLIDRSIENAVVRAIFGGNELSRRRFMSTVGSATALSIISQFFPLSAAKSMAKEMTFSE